MTNQNALAVRGESAPVSMNQQHAGVMDLMLRGNLNGLTDEQIMQVYIARCDSMGIDARTKPFDVLVLSGAKVLYPNARLADQLIDKHGLSVEVLSEETVEDIYRVKVRVSDGFRVVNASGALPVGGLSGSKLADAWMKCETKAVRRGVLRFCGLGAQPTPQQEEERRKHGLRLVHAMGADRGLKHEEIRAIAQQHYAIESMTELDADDLAELSDAIEAQIAFASDPWDAAIADGMADIVDAVDQLAGDEPIDVDPETGEIIDATLADDDLVATFESAIELASTVVEIETVRTDMKSAGITEDSHPGLIKVWRSKRNTMTIEAAKANRATQDQRERANAAANAA